MRKIIVRFFCLFAFIVLWARASVSCCEAFADAQILPANLITIEKEAFFGDSSIVEMIIPEGAETVGEKAFAYSGLKCIYIPESVNTIKADAFLGCEGLTFWCAADSYAQRFADKYGITWVDVSAYANVIEKYREYYKNGVKTEPGASAAGVSEISAFCNHIGYTYKDLNDDRIPELIIADCGSSKYGFADNMMLDLYTLVNNKAIRITASGARSRNYLRTDSTILNSGSNGAGHSIWELRQLADGKLKPIEAIFNYYYLENEQYRYYYQTENVTGYPRESDSQLDKATFDAKRAEYESAVYLPPLVLIV